jgi:hypothetical protein
MRKWSSDGTDEEDVRFDDDASAENNAGSGDAPRWALEGRNDELRNNSRYVQDSVYIVQMNCY